MKAEIPVEMPRPDVQLPEFRESAYDSTTTPLHPGWLPVLARVPLFSSLSQHELRKVANLAELRRFRRGAEIVRAGMKGNAFFVILDGSADVTTPAGHKRALHEGDYFGELALLDGAPRAATVKAANSLAAARISRTAFTQLLKDEPKLGVGLARGLVALVRDMQAD
jgi:CRP-like cAMP-binding protein